MVGFTASIASLGVAFQAQASGIAHGYSPTDYLALAGNPIVSGIELHFFPHSVVSTLVSNKWPDTLVFDEYPIDPSPPARPLNLTGLQGVHGAMIASAFVRYFEGTRSIVESKHSRSYQQWPEIWNFARVLRNALAHNGVIRFDNPKATAVTWRSLSYSPSNNGKLVLYVDVTAVELIILMEEMDASL